MSDKFERKRQLLVLSARQASSLDGLVKEYIDYFEHGGEDNLPSICYTAAQGRNHFEERLAVVGESGLEMKTLLEMTAQPGMQNGIKRGTARKGNEVKKIAFMFSGQGSQFNRMGKELYETLPIFRNAINDCDQLFSQYAGESLKDILFDSQDQKLNETQFTQPCLFAIEYALFQVWKSWGITPHALIGHSLGEYVAATVSEAMNLADGMKLVTQRAKMMQAQNGKGEMVAALASEAIVKELIEELDQNIRKKISIAAVNGPESTVIAGYADAITEAVSKLEARKIKCKRLKVSHAFHSPQMDGMLKEFEGFASEIRFSKPKIKVISNLTGGFVSEFTPAYWRDHVRYAVRFSDGIKVLQKEGFADFLEVGPGTVLLELARLSLNDVGSFVASLRKSRTEWEQILETLGQFYVQGYAINWKEYEAGFEKRRKVDLPTYSFLKQRFWAEGAKFGVSSVDEATPLEPSANVVKISEMKTPAHVFMQSYIQTAPEIREQKMKEFLRGHIAQILGLDSMVLISPETDLSALGMDSLALIELRSVLEKEFGKYLEGLSRSMIFSYSNLEQLSRFLHQRVSSQLDKAKTDLVLRRVPARDPWIRCVRKSDSPQARIFCFHFAGGSAQNFDTFAAKLPSWLELHAIQLPGRWERHDELPILDIERLSDLIGTSISQLNELPYYVLGYSMGALVAYRVLQRMWEKKDRQPECFIAASCPAPKAVLAKSRRFKIVEDREKFLTEFRKSVGSLPANFVNNADMQEMFIPILRNDLKLVNNIKHREFPPFEFPILAVAGSGDISVNTLNLQQWSLCTTQTLKIKWYDGDHFFLNAEIFDGLMKELILQFGPREGSSSISRAL